MKSFQTEQGPSSILDKLNEQVWFQQIKAKWDEVPLESRNAIQISGISIISISILSGLLYFGLETYTLKKQYNDRLSILSLLQNATDEINRLKEKSSLSGAEEKGGWDSYFTKKAEGQHITKEQITISPESAIGSGGATKELAVTLTMKHINIKQFTNLVQSIENGERPVKVRNINVDTHFDPEGYLDAKIIVSAFEVATDKNQAPAEKEDSAKGSAKSGTKKGSS